MAVASLEFREFVDQVRQSSRILRGIALRALVGAAAAVVLVVATQAVALGFSHLFRWGSLFTPVSVNSYGTFVGIAVGAQATFLALFFTTVGVIASTAYSRVPGEIRTLFVRERTSAIYVWNVVMALVVGIALLTFPVLSAREFRGLVILLFATLTTFSVLSLVILGRNLFNFFDPSTLTERLYPQFMRAVRNASAAGDNVPDEPEQERAHLRAATVLRQYDQLVTLITQRDVQDTTAPQRIAYQLVGCWTFLATFKSTIPVKSEWFARTASHPNWLVMDQAQLSTALETRSGVQPTLAPDALWVERRFSNMISALLPSLTSEGDWSRLISVLDGVNELIFELAKRMQFDEALLLVRVVRTYRQTVLSGVAQDAGVSEDSTNVFRLALAEREILGYTTLWLGLARPLEYLNPEHLARSFDTAANDPSGPYQVGAPRELLSLLEDVADGIAFERDTEHERVTPDWWLHHLAARVYAKTIVEAVHDLISEVEVSLVEPLAADHAGDAEIIAVRIFDLLELLHKIEFHLRTVRAALVSLQSLRHESTKDELWPELSLPDSKAQELEEKLLIRLGAASMQLPFAPHDNDKPDLFGQAYRRLFDAAFHAILNGRDDVARHLFPVVIATADRARGRLALDLAGERVRQRAIFGTEPLVDMMELSGYALLMSLVTGDGIWPNVRAAWEQILDADPGLGEQLTGVLTFQEDIFALTSGGLGRTGRQMELSRILRERGVVNQSHMWGQEPEEPHPDPVVATFAPDDMMGVNHDLADLFVVEYLIHRPDMVDLPISHGADRLRESLEFERQRRRDAEDGDPEDDDDDDK